MNRIFSNLTFQVLVAILLGIAVGVIFPSFYTYAELISKSFINMISMLIAPIIFFEDRIIFRSVSNFQAFGKKSINIC